MDDGIFSYSINILRSILCQGDIPAHPVFLPMIDDSHCFRVHSFLKAVHCFDNVKAASGLKRVLCGVKVYRSSGKH